MTDADASLVRNLLENCLHQGRLELLDDYCDENFTDHTRPPGTPAGRESERASLAAIRAAFDPVEVTIEEALVDGDLIATRGRFRGRHAGEFMGVPGSGKEFDVAAMDMFRVANGKLIEHWGLIDMAAFASQLGLDASGVSEGSPA